ncbi:hypothetical protein CLOM_g21185 [Closterium sp. NIES-68]|nr:hypothetical protein CLOM_g21185 [Closterium sp. NIES-68]GJP81272.1 hypothetical protein CLOP_g11431 [Closterium sp. NIES-67]
MAFLRLLFVLLSASATLCSFPPAHAQVAQPRCPRPPTVAQVNLSAYAGRWFEVGTSARFKLQRENGLVCNQARYTLTGAADSAGGAGTNGSGLSLGVENSGRLVASPAVLQSMASVAGNSRDACIALANVSSAAASAVQLLQSQPQAASAIADCSQVNATNEFLNIGATSRTISASVSTIASLAARISQLDFQASSLNVLANQLLLQASAAADKAGQIAYAASRIQSASSNCSGSSAASDGTNTWAAVSAAAASIVESANSLRDALNWVAAAVAPYAGSDIVSISLASIASVPLPFGGIPTSVFGQAVPSTSDPAKLTVTFNLFPSASTEPNYWILALEGSAEQGYESALVYSCTEPQGSDDPMPRIDVFVISRAPYMLEDELQELLGVLTGYGVVLGCDNPFVRTVQDSARCGY